MIEIIDSLGEPRYLMPEENQAIGEFCKSLPVFGETAGSPPLLTDAELADLAVNGFNNDWVINHIKDQNGVGQCLIACTLIRMADGSDRPVEQVKVGDNVLTAEGRTGRVSNTVINDETSAVYSLSGDRPLRATRNHPVLTRHGYLSIGELTTDHDIALPRLGADPIWRRAGEITRHDFRGKVFNFEVEGDHSYVAEGIGVHNCNCEATVYTMEGTRVITGLPYIELAPAHLYGKINGGRDQGSMLEDAVKEANIGGVSEAKLIGHTQWKKSSWPPGLAVNAKQYRITEWWWCPKTVHLFSAAARGFLCNIGVKWGSNDNPDGDGWMPNAATGRTGGHAICRVPTIVHRGDELGIKGPNSWTANWGVRGWMTFGRKRLDREAGSFGWFATRVVTLADADPPAPPLSL